MAIKQTQRGFALLVAIIFMSVMLTFGLTLASLSYKQQVLASNAIQSQYAFYVADAALECALYADQQLNLFAYPASAPATAPKIVCDGVAEPYSSDVPILTPSYLIVKESLSLDAGLHCADVTVYKSAPGSGLKTYLFSQGYDVPCATVKTPNGARFAARGLKVHY